MLDAGAADDAAPVGRRGGHRIGRIDPLADLVEIGVDRLVAGDALGLVDQPEHLVAVEILEGVAERDLALEPAGLGDRGIVGGNPRGGELRRAVDVEQILVRGLGAIVVADAGGEHRLRAEQRRLAADVELGGVGLGHVLRLQRAQAGQRRREILDRGHLCTARERPVGIADRAKQLDLGKLRVGQVIADGQPVGGVREAGALVVQLRRLRPVVDRAGEVAAPCDLPFAEFVVTADRVGEYRLLVFAHREVRVEIDAVDGAEQGRVAGADVGIAGGARRGACVDGAAGAAGRRTRLLIVEIEDVVVALLVIRERRVDRFREQLVAGRRAPVEPGRQRVVLPRQAIQLVLGLARPVARLVAGALVFLDRFEVGLEIVGDHAAAVQAGGRDDAEFADAGVDPIGDDERALIFRLLAEFDMAEAALGLDLHARIVERRAGDDVDIAGDRLAGHVGGDGFPHDDLRSDRRWDGVEAGIAAFGADDVDAVDRQCGPVDRGAAQRDVARLALVALDADAGQAADRLCDVLIGQATDRVRGDDRDERRAGALDLECGRLGFRDRARAGDDDLRALACACADFGGHRDVERHWDVGDRHGPACIGKADIADHELVRASGDADQREATGAIDDRRLVECGDRDRGAIEIVAAAGLRHGAGDRAGRAGCTGRRCRVGTRMGARNGQRAQRAAGE